MENQFSVSEMENLRSDYLHGRDLDCPRCGQLLMSYVKEGELLQGQRPGGPTFNFLDVYCSCEEVSEKIILSM